MEGTTEFAGHLSIAALRRDYHSVPSVRGVYIVYVRDDFIPTFLESSRGGHFKKKDPTLPVEELKTLWVAGASVLYIGSTGGGEKSERTLRDRIRELLDFASGKPVGHWGGRVLWQVKNAEQLFLVAWRTLPDEDPRIVKKKLIEDFRQKFGKRPFANLR